MKQAKNNELIKKLVPISGRIVMSGVDQLPNTESLTLLLGDIFELGSKITLV
jgi:hypothetical protein